MDTQFSLTIFNISSFKVSSIFKQGFFALSIVFIGTLTAYSQDLLVKFDFKAADGIEMYPVVDRKGQLSLFAVDNKTIRRYFFDKNLSLISQSSVKIPDDLHGDLLGVISDSASYQLFFGNKSKSKFNAVIIDPDKAGSPTLIPELHLEKEKFLESFEFDGKFYVLTIKKGRSVLGLYVFEKGKPHTSVDIDLQKFEFDGYTNLYELIESNMNGSIVPNRCTKIDVQSPNSLESASKLNKMYLYDEQLYLTVENDDETNVISLSLRDYSSSVKPYKLKSQCTSEFCTQNANSFLDHQTLYKLTACYDQLMLTITDLKSNTVLQTYRATKDADISFRNSAIIQDGSNINSFTGTENNSTKEITKTKAFFRKIAENTVAVAPYRVNDVVYVTLGSYTETSGGGGGGMMMAGGAGGMGTMPIFVHNPVFGSFGSYINRRSVYFKSVFSATDFKHQTGTTPPLAFDKIKEADDSVNGQKSKTIFRIGEYYVWGYCMSLENTYYLKKFTDDNFTQK